MLRLRGITVNCVDPEGLATFWAAALSYDRRPCLWEPYAGVTDPTGYGPHMTFQRSTAPAGTRLHVDLYADDPEQEVTRLESIGATRVRRVDEGDTWWWVLRDPESNEFCVIATLGEGRSLNPLE